ncbi:MAG: HEAT repeat domain-containing protein, partial [Candidatus Eremiobacterota bacterium]
MKSRHAWLCVLLLLLLALPAQADNSVLLGRIAALEESRQPFGDELRSYLGHPDDGVRRRAARAAGRLQDPAAVRWLAELLTDPSGDVRLEAIFALGQIPGRDSERVLLKAAQREPGPELILAALKVGGQATLDRLDNWLEDPDPAIRGEAALSAGRYVMRRLRWEPELPELPPRLTVRLRELADDPEPEVREAALYALYRLK